MIFANVNALDSKTSETNVHPESKGEVIPGKKIELTILANRFTA